MAISTNDLHAIAERVRRAAGEAGELEPPEIGAIHTELPNAIRAAVMEDLRSGAYERAAAAATADDPDLIDR